MVSLSETRELLLAVSLIAGFAGAFLFFNMSLPSSLDILPEIVSPTPGPRVLGATTRVPLVANPVVHITVPEHNIFAPQ